MNEIFTQIIGTQRWCGYKSGSIINFCDFGTTHNQRFDYSEELRACTFWVNMDLFLLILKSK